MARQRVEGRRPATRAALIVWVCVAAALTSCHDRTRSPLVDRLLGAGDLTGFTPGPSTLVTDAGVWAKPCPSGEAARLRTAGFVAGSSEHLTASNLRGRDAVSFVTQFRSVASASADVLHALRTHSKCSTTSQLSAFRVPAIPGAYGIAAERSDGAGYDVLFSDGTFSYDVGAFTPDRSGRPTAHDVAVAATKLYLRVHARAAGSTDASSFQVRATSPRVRAPSPRPRGSGSPALPATWTRIPPNAELFGPDFEMSAVTAGGPGLVAVGHAEVDRRIGRHDISAIGAIWTSSDGLQWRRIAQRQIGYGALNDVAAGTNGLVAVGADATFTNAAVWTSPNGEVWTRLPMDRAVFGRAAMSAVTPFGSGFVAVGDTISGDRLDRPTAWVSVDGTRWERRVVPGRPNALWSDVTSFRGHLFAVGTVGGPDPETFVAAVWSSADGRTWVRTAHFPASPGSNALSVTRGPNGLIAVGRTGGRATVWSSLDGIRWRRLPPDPAFLFDPEPVPKGSVRVVSIDAVAGGPAGYVAIGYDAVCPRGSVACGSRPVTVWTSRNGQSWVRRAVVAAFVGDRVAEANGLVPWGSRFVAVGSDAEWFVRHGPQQAAVWISDPA